MNSVARIYRAEILRAVLGDKANEAKVEHIARLNQIAEHLAHSEEAQTALRAKGYGRSGMSFLEVVREVPTNALGCLRTLFTPKASVKRYPDLNEVFDIWTAR
jgi:hypothetical protein